MPDALSAGSAGAGGTLLLRLFQPLLPQALGIESEQLAGRDGKRIGQPDQRPGSRLKDAVFQIAQITLADAGTARKGILAYAAFFPQGHQQFSKGAWRGILAHRNEAYPSLAKKITR